MGPTTAPLLSTLTKVGVGMLMLLSSFRERKLSWRPRPVERHRHTWRIGR